jgi:feruloyl esterase
MEAQRFPNDYDGIVGGAPAHNRTGVHMSILWNFAVVETDPAAYLPPAKLQLISTAVLAACDAVDAVKDGIIADPLKCNFDPAVLRCADANSANCLTPPQVDAVRRLYAGPANSRTGISIYPGLPKGSEFGWDHLGPAPALATEPPFAPIFKWVFGPQWNWRTFHFDSSTAEFENKLASTLNATNPNIDAFRSHGGKLILYHGWADWLVPPGETIRYYDAVAARDQHLGVTTDDSLRLFMVPGMAHCGGGPGPDQFDALGAAVQWVEKREPPQNLIAAKLVNHTPAFRRLLCPFPQIAVYRGSGDVNDDRSYTCVGAAESREKDQH